jgi:hypothetical protein
MLGDVCQALKSKFLSTPSETAGGNNGGAVQDIKLKTINDNAVRLTFIRDSPLVVRA